MGQGCVKGHGLGVDLHRVGVECREDRRVLVQFEIGLVDRHLRGVDRLGDSEAAFLQLAPGLVAQTLVFPERGIGKTIRPANDDAVDVALQAAVSDRETELLTVGLAGAQVKACIPQPRDHAVLHDMATLEDAQHPARDITPVIDRSLGIFELQRTLAGHAETRGPEVLAFGLAGASLLHPGVDQDGDLTGDA